MIEIALTTHYFSLKCCAHLIYDLCSTHLILPFAKSEKIKSLKFGKKSEDSLAGMLPALPYYLTMTKFLSFNFINLAISIMKIPGE